MTRKAEIAAAREADTRIAAAWAAYWAEYDKASGDRIRLADLRKSQRRSVRPDDYIEDIEHREERIAAVMAVAAPLREAAIALDNDLYTGWNRFFLVKHIHRSTHCSSFRPSTRIGWLPDVSGLTEAEAVKTHGETLCTICFPSAPTELTTKQADPSLCAGSGTPVDRSRLTGRENAYYSPDGTCATCGQRVGLTSRGSGKVRKHKAA